MKFITMRIFYPRWPAHLVSWVENPRAASTAVRGKKKVFVDWRGTWYSVRMSVSAPSVFLPVCCWLALCSGSHYSVSARCHTVVGGRRALPQRQHLHVCYCVCVCFFAFCFFTGSIYSIHVSLTFTCESAPLPFSTFVLRRAPTHRCSDCVDTLMVRAPHRVPNMLGGLLESSSRWVLSRRQCFIFLLHRAATSSSQDQTCQHVTYKIFEHSPAPAHSALNCEPQCWHPKGTRGWMWLWLQVNGQNWACVAVGGYRFGYRRQGENEVKD